MVGQIKNSSSLILRSTCHFSRGLHDDCGPQEYLFLRKKQEFVGVGEEKLSKIKVYISTGSPSALFVGSGFRGHLVEDTRIISVLSDAK